MICNGSMCSAYRGGTAGDHPVLGEDRHGALGAQRLAVALNNTAAKVVTAPLCIAVCVATWK